MGNNGCGIQILLFIMFLLFLSLFIYLVTVVSKPLSLIGSLSLWLGGGQVTTKSGVGRTDLLEVRRQRHWHA